MSSPSITLGQERLGFVLEWRGTLFTVGVKERIGHCILIREQGQRGFQVMQEKLALEIWQTASKNEERWPSSGNIYGTGL